MSRTFSALIVQLLLVLQICFARVLTPLEGELSLNLRPLIGVLSQPGRPAPTGHSYIAASYVKFIEASGGRAVPIECDLPPAEVEARFKTVNGLLIPGGGADLSPNHPFYDTASQLLNLTLAANDAGDYFPMHGTCLGMEALAILLSSPYNRSVLSSFDSLDNPSPLIFTRDSEDSRFFKSMPKNVVEGLQSRPLAMENHHWGISSDTFTADHGLSSFFKVTSMSLDKAGRPYISTIEARKYPITATQWHPEKNAFEWANQLHIPHTAEAVEVTHAVSNFLVNEARKNSHRPKDVQQETDILIYNHSPVFTGKVRSEGTETSFDQCYFFPNRS